MTKKALFAIWFLLGAFFSLILPVKPVEAGGCSAKVETVYILSEDYAPYQGCSNWHYYSRKTSLDWRLHNRRWLRMWIDNEILPAQYEDGPHKLKSIWGESTDGPYWNSQGYDWLLLSRYHSAGGDNEKALVYWQAPVGGTATMTVTDQKIDFLRGNSKGNGYVFGIGFANKIGKWTNTLRHLYTSGGDKSSKTLTFTKRLNEGEAMLYFKDPIWWTYGDVALYSIKIEFTAAAPIIDNLSVQSCASTSCSGYQTAFINGQNFGPDILIEAIGNSDRVHYANKQNIRLTGRTGTTQLIVDFDSLPCQTYKLRLFYPDSNAPTLTRDVGYLGSFSCPRG